MKVQDLADAAAKMSPIFARLRRVSLGLCDWSECSLCPPWADVAVRQHTRSTAQYFPTVLAKFGAVFSESQHGQVPHLAWLPKATVPTIPALQVSGCARLGSS